MLRNQSYKCVCRGGGEMGEYEEKDVLCGASQGSRCVQMCNPPPGRPISHWQRLKGTSVVAKGLRFEGGREMKEGKVSSPLKPVYYQSRSRRHG